MNLIKRTATAVVLLGSLFVLIQYAPAWAFFLVGLAFVGFALLEFYDLNDKNGQKPQKALGLILTLLILLTFYFRSLPIEAALFASILVAGVYYVVTVNTADKLSSFPASFATTLIGVLYVAFPLGFIFWIRQDDGPFCLYFLAAIVFLGDSGAFFIGKPFGRHKMTPIASPNKSWEGSAGGFLFAATGAVLAWFILLP